jgi:hypothetical protein
LGPEKAYKFFLSACFYLHGIVIHGSSITEKAALGNIETKALKGTAHPLADM